MLKAASLVFSCFMLGVTIPASLEAHKLITAPPPPVALTSEAQTIDAARDVCVKVTAARRVSDCKVVRWVRSVNFSLDISATEAAKVCAGTANEAARTGGFARNGWTIRIYSHYAVAPIATCHLR